MPQLRRLGIAAEEPTKLAAFYQKVFDLEVIGEERGAVFLSDGTFNLALLPKTDVQTHGLSYLGFEAARIESLEKKLAHFGSGDTKIIDCEPTAGIEFEMRDPDNNAIG